jgi:NADH-quinone oxidoreductase subunit L
MILATILLLPLIGFLLLSLSGKRIAKPIGGIVASSLVGLSFLLSLFVFTMLRNGNPLHAELFTWISTAGFTSAFALQADALSIIMIMLVTGVSTLIHVYSIGYMSEDENFNQFFSYLNLFVFFMLILVMADNYLLLFAGWEGVGLCSYLLIGFWFKNPEYAKAGNKAFVMNRIGDLGFLLGIATIFYTFGSLSFQEIQVQLDQGIGTNQLTLIALLLFVGAIGKSAQIPLFTWLPDAMAGPTPVSALIHAATMVTAGIYLIIRSKAIYILSPVALIIVASVGIITALFAASIALKQNDIKKILAYSTVSQLGLMFFALGLGAFDAALFHLVTHAFFKALLFLCAGSVIHALHGQQDIRLMGGLKSKINITFFTMLIGTLAISGIPPFSGFFSKDTILSAALEANPLLWFLAFAVSLLTAIYMFRLLFLVFYGNYRGIQKIWDSIHESPLVMTVPLLVLGTLSFAGGLINIPYIFHGSQWLSHFIGIIAPVAEHNNGLEWILMTVTVSLLAGLFYFSFSLFHKKNTVPPENDQYHGFSKVLMRKYYIDEIYDAIVVKPFSWLSEKLYSIVDIKIIDGMVNGIGNAIISLSRAFRLLQNGSVSYYLLFMVVGLIVILFFNLFY